MATNLEVTNTAPVVAPMLRLSSFAPQIGLLFSIAAGLTLAVGVVMWAMRPTFVVLDSQLSASNSTAVIAQLQSRKIPYELDSTTGNILVPSEKLAEIRMYVGASGISSGGSFGPEMLVNDQSIGTSSQVMNERFRLIKQTELARTIMSWRGIESARVHLALPKRTSFVRRRSQASASVSVALAPGRGLDQSQVLGIINLIASSVPNMDISRVTVVDQSGRLLSRDVVDGNIAISNQQLAHRRSVERDYQARLEALLAPMVGINGVRAQVNAVMDFSAIERHEESFAGKPDQIRSERTEENRSDSAMSAQGVPGALTNQPPEGGSIGEGAASANGDGASGSMQKSTMRNYEVDKTTTSRRDAPGRLQRLSVAVLVDHKAAFDADGKPTRVAREKEELDSITSLVKEAVGFDEERGDSVIVVNRDFQIPPSIEVAPEPKMWEQSWFDAVVKNVLAAIVMGLVLLLVLRPAVRALTGKVAKPENVKQATDGESDEFPMLDSDEVSLSSAGGALPPPPRVYGDILNLAREMANEDPKRVAMVLRKWVDTDE